MLQINKNIKVVEFEDLKIEVKQYLPILDKMTIIELITQNCIQENENGIKYSNSILEEIFKTYYIVRFYAPDFDLATLSDSIFEVYDILESSGLMFKIKETIELDELDFIDKHLWNAIADKIDNEQSIANVVDKFLKGIVERIPDEKTIKKVLKDLKNFDPNNYQMIQDVLKFNNPKPESKE